MPILKPVHAPRFLAHVAMNAISLSTRGFAYEWKSIKQNVWTTSRANQHEKKFKDKDRLIIEMIATDIKIQYHFGKHDFGYLMHRYNKLNSDHAISSMLVGFVAGTLSSPIYSILELISDSMSENMAKLSSPIGKLFIIIVMALFAAFLVIPIMFYLIRLTIYIMRIDNDRIIRLIEKEILSAHLAKVYSIPVSSIK